MMNPETIWYSNDESRDNLVFSDRLLRGNDNSYSYVLLCKQVLEQSKLPAMPDQQFQHPFPGLFEMTGGDYTEDVL